MVSKYPDASDEAPLILTLWMDDASQARLEALRQAHFPAERNFIPAHLTLFHALPGERRVEVSADLAAVAAETPPLPFSTAGILPLGRGAAVRIDCPGLAALRDGLRARWQPHLGRQDLHGHRPHVTVQNKVSAETARRTVAALGTLAPFAGTAEGLILWRYLGGPWDEVARHAFAAPRDPV